MENIYLSKSKYCKAVQCNKILWLDKYKKEFAIDTANEAVLENGTEVGNLAKGLFGKYVDIEFSENLSEMIEATKKALNNKPNIITEASFDYQGNFCSVDILKNDTDGIEIYEVKSSTDIKEIYIEDISYQVYVLKQLGFWIKKASIVYLNRKYERQGELDLKQLFTIKDVTKITMSKQKQIEKKLEEIDNFMLQEEEPAKELGIQCFKPYSCQYWEYCSQNLPEKNVFQIRDMRLTKKLELYKQGKIGLEDVKQEKINSKFIEQIDFELNNKEPKIEKEKIEKFMDTLYYPLYFLDFETFQQAIPQFDGIRPYMQIPFQYSLHYIEKENSKLQHKEFLAEAGSDPRRKIAERLVEDIPDNACVLAYNMSFEKTVIKNLAEQFEDLREKLLKIRENIKDLMTPFSKRNYYMKEMQGSYSIKSVLPALFPDEPDLDYHNLPVVHNGAEAMSIFAELGKYPKEEQDKIREGLLKYCELDTYAMVKIWEKLNYVIYNEEKK